MLGIFISKVRYAISYMEALMEWEDKPLGRKFTVVTDCHIPLQWLVNM